MCHYGLVGDSGAAVADAEERGLQDVDVTFFDKFREELEEEGDDEQSDMHAIDVGVGGDDDFVVAQCVEAVFDVEGSL